MRRSLAGLLLLGAAVTAAAAEPRLEHASAGAAQEPAWMLTALPPLLADEGVAEHLTRGLTTSFVFHLEARDAARAKVEGGARVDVRYDPWDEVFHVATLGIDGAGEQLRLASLAELQAWWRGARLLVLAGAATRVAAGPEVRLTLEVVPFSQAERDDTRQWFSDSLDKAGRSSAEEVGQAAEERPDRLARVLNLLLATSIERRAVTSYRWTVARPAERAP